MIRLEYLTSSLFNCCVRDIITYYIILHLAPYKYTPFIQITYLVNSLSALKADIFVLKFLRSIYAEARAAYATDEVLHSMCLSLNKFKMSTKNNDIELK